jgi:hypothetical protein
MRKSSQIAWIAWKIVPLRHLFPLKIVPLIDVFLYWTMGGGGGVGGEGVIDGPA